MDTARIPQFPTALNADTATRVGRMLEAGDVRVTITDGATREHITVRFKAVLDNRPGSDGRRHDPSEDRNWLRCPLSDATHVYVEVPNASGEFPDKIGTFYPKTGRFFPDRNADQHRIEAACIVADWLAGNPHHEDFYLQEEAYCGKCGKTLTDPVSIDRGIGPECYKKPTDSKHQVKEKIEPARTVARSILATIANDCDDRATEMIRVELNLWHEQGRRTTLFD